MRLSKIIALSFIVGFILILLFLYLHPKAGAVIFPVKSQMLLTEFLEQSQKSQDIKLQQYWEFREFYSPGSFVYEKNGLSKDQNRAIAYFTAQDPGALPQLLFVSKKVISVGGKTKNTRVPTPQGTEKQTVLKTNSVVLLETDMTVTLIFLKPISEIKKANGFLQKEPDHDEKQKENWLEITTIQK